MMHNQSSLNSGSRLWLNRIQVPCITLSRVNRSIPREAAQVGYEVRCGSIHRPGVTRCGATAVLPPQSPYWDRWSGV